MKYFIAAILSTALMTTGIAATKHTANSNTQQFKTIEEAGVNCPPAESIGFEPGTPAPDAFAKIGYITATFSASLNGTTFMNSTIDTSCPVGTPKPKIFDSAKKAKQLQKKGKTICLLIISPILADNSKNIKTISPAEIDGSYGSKDGKSIRCNYKYTGVDDPETSKPIETIVILRSV
jgi:hypothetical protein